MTDQELKEILERHQHFLNKDCYGWLDMRADLSNADLHGVNLTRADLTSAIMLGVNLHNAILVGANLSYACLADANLSGANLRNANFYNASLIRADLSETILLATNFRYADLMFATLSNTMDANDNTFYYARLLNAKNIPYIPLCCPEEGSFIAYKRARNYIIKLKIPADAKRTSATTRKCRCDKAIVLDIQNLDGTKAFMDSVRSNYCKDFIYRIGETVKVDNFDDNRWKECTTGIHFFINRQDAVNYS